MISYCFKLISQWNLAMIPNITRFPDVSGNRGLWVLDASGNHESWVPDASGNHES